MEVIWEGDGGGKKSIYNSLLSSLSVLPDAAMFELDTSGSTIPYPATGNAVLRVKNVATGAISASQTFSWVRTGTVIRVADPNAVNAWIYANVGNGDALSYDLLPSIRHTVVARRLSLGKPNRRALSRRATTWSSKDGIASTTRRRTCAWRCSKQQKMRVRLKRPRLWEKG